LGPVSGMRRSDQGSSGGPNLLWQDVCYSFWAGALGPAAGVDVCVDVRGLVGYILAISQQGLGKGETAGFADKPGAEPDFYHTCYALSGLSVATHYSGNQTR
jgi:protein farnesyltransferase subunit beta